MAGVRIPSSAKAASPADRFRCIACGDEGIVSLPGDEWMPCTCKAGDKWRADPPACYRCGEPAKYCLLSSKPMCKACDLSDRRRG